MGQIKRQTLGDVFGAVGHLVFKNRGGVNYISHRPVTYATPQDPRSVLIRKQFRFTSKLAKSINSINILKKIWRNQYPKCYSIYHKIFDSNYHKYNADNLSGEPLLTPDMGFQLDKPEVELNGKYLIIKAGTLPTGTRIDTLKQNFIVAASLLVYRSHARPDDPPLFQPIIGNIIPLDLSQPINLTAEIIAPHGTVAEDEYIFQAWSVLIILDKKQIPIHYSVTLSWP